MKMTVADDHLLVYIYGDDNSPYPIDFERLGTCSNLLDWIFQLAGKEGVISNEDLGRFVRFLNETLDPQQHYCGFGKDLGPVDVKAAIKGTAEFKREVRKFFPEERPN